jgi:hypothetical protein
MISKLGGDKSWLAVAIGSLEQRTRLLHQYERDTWHVLRRIAPPQSNCDVLLSSL